VSLPPTFEGRSWRGTLQSPWPLRFLTSRLSGLFGASTAYSEHVALGPSPQRPELHTRSLVSGREKLIERRDEQTESYDLVDDPGEKNASGLPPQETDRLRASIATLLRKLQQNQALRQTHALDEETRERMRALGYDDRSK
jgi:hypothetical protein